MAENGPNVYPPPPRVQGEAHVKSLEEYRELYKQSVEQPQIFWGNIAKDFYFKVAPQDDRFLDFNFDVNKGPISIKWMQGAVTNICYNALDRNIKDKGMGDKVAFYW